jgi:putative ABC transport system permease protein
MLKNYLIVAWRNLVRHKLYSLLNIAGLTVSLTCCILLLLYVRDELSYDRYHEHAEHIYRVVLKATMPDRSLEAALSTAALAPSIGREMPEVISAARIWSSWGGDAEKLVSFGERGFYETRFFWADPEIFQVFTLPLRRGDAKTALVAPNTVVLTQATARRYFGEEEPVGKTLRLGNETDYQVTGVLAELPENVHLHFDFLASSSTQRIEGKSTWIANNYFTYLLLREDADPEQVTAQIGEMVERNTGELLHSMGITYRYALQPLTDIHLHSHLLGEAEPNSDIAYVYVLTAVAVFVLLIAGINFVNLATARSAGRIREVGIRKVIGARRSQVIVQFLGESTLLCLMALGLSLVLVELLLSAFGAFTGKHLALTYGGDLGLFLGLVCAVLGLGAMAGSCPALFFSSVSPVTALKGLGVFRRRAHYRGGLVSVQFAISIGLIIGTLGMIAQMKYVRNKHLGFDRGNLVIVPVRTNELRQSLEMVKVELQRLPGIASVGVASALPVSYTNRSSFWLKGQPPEDMLLAAQMGADYDFLSTMGMQVKEGRDFSREFDQHTEVCIVNEAMARTLGAGSAVGKEIGTDPRDTGSFFKVIGVVRDFHFQSLHHLVEPLVIRLGEAASDYMVRQANYLAIRLEPGEIDKILAATEQEWKETTGGVPFEYFFLDSRVQQLYRSEEKAEKVLGVFTAVAIFIACLGLFGLASFMAERRTKEIGIRKVLGASIPSIVALLSKEFTYLVLVANVIAWPVAYFAMRSWLDDFAYRIDLGPGVFVLGGVLALMVAWLTVSYQAIRAAMANPVEALRYE